MVRSIVAVMNRLHIGGDLDTLSYRGGIQDHIHGHVAPHLDDDALSDEFPETGLFRSDRVRAGLNKAESVPAGLIGLFDEFHSGVIVPERHGRSRDRGLGRIGYQSLHGRTVVLREGRTGEKRKKEY
jgi:hypothetical protein